MIPNRTFRAAKARIQIHVFPSCVSSWVLTLKNSPSKNNTCLSVCPSVRPLVRGISGRRIVLIEKMNRSKVVPNFPRMFPNPLTFFRALNLRTKRVFAFLNYEEVPEGGFESKTWREANLFVIPRKRSWDLRQCKLTLKWKRSHLKKTFTHETRFCVSSEILKL